jgi:hypothetical protein
MSKDIWRYFDEYIIRGKTTENPSCCNVIIIDSVSTLLIPTQFSRVNISRLGNFPNVFTLRISRSVMSVMAIKTDEQIVYHYLGASISKNLGDMGA